MDRGSNLVFGGLSCGTEPIVRKGRKCGLAVLGSSMKWVIFPSSCETCSRYINVYNFLVSKPWGAASGKFANWKLSSSSDYRDKQPNFVADGSNK